MIDLTRKSLPNTVTVGGRDFSIHTDFRLWMKFEIEVSKLGRNEKLDVSALFVNEMPERCDLRELFVFSKPQNPLPRGMECHNDVIVLDYELDSELIYAAFMEQYGIDLTEVELHWHKFLALLRGLNESTRLRQVMGYRCYVKSGNKDRDIYEELRRAWEIEPRVTVKEQAELDDFSKIFGGCCEGLTEA